MKTYNIFVSHAWKYSSDYDTVVRWLDDAEKNGEFDWKNYSVPEHDPLIDPSTTTGKTKLKEALKGQIRPVSIVIVISGMYAAHSDWIDFEIDYSVELGKYIIGLKPWGQERVPAKIQDNADTMIGWNSSSLVNAIKNL